MKILFVDDEPAILEQGKIFLQRENDRLEVETATSPQKALEMLNNSEYEAIVSDYQMPEMNGLEFLEKIRQKMDSDIPFIVFTGKGREEVAMEALNLGADRYLRKGGSPKSQYSILAETIVHEIRHRQMEERLELTNYSLENAEVGALWISPEGRIKYANDWICQKLGYDNEEMMEKTVSDIDPNYPDERPEIWKDIKKKGRKTFESEHRTKSGETFPVEITSHYLERNGKEYEFAFIHDITELKEKERKRRKAEESLKASERRFREFFESLPVMGFMISKDGKVKEVNERFCDNSGYETHL
ncbi:hypothetical protein AKJ41_05010 [candidate division MSBL1 archaeon SCGC-AAA259O05]|uniref:Histidine kinase n=1 Tax=candidate division MSBL1 archaeon SCGC-AAA259O05 TaxID=1698271 RepID=A0A133UZU4_9EURY|nr:hypothetical protein AKJ41_05010 [candidate division MSBL1 archaeon SCGC-AAA259O05]